MDARLTPTVVAIAATVCCRDAYIRRATASFCGVMTGGRPPARPRARAAASPAAVRSWVRSQTSPNDLRPTALEFVTVPEAAYRACSAPAVGSSCS